MTPTLTLKLKNDHQIAGIFESGYGVSLISYEWLIERELISPLKNPSMLLLGRKKVFGSYIKIDAYIPSESATPKWRSIDIFAVVNFDEVWEIKEKPKEIHAVFGRNIPKHFEAIVELNFEDNTTRLLQKDWNDFEREVANCFRMLGLSVIRNYNLSGNQIDVYLTEDTRSGKPLRTIVECKYHRNPIGVQLTRNFSNLVEFARVNKLAEHGILVSSSGLRKMRT